MTILADWQIIQCCEQENMIAPFERKSIKWMVTAQGMQKILSYGLSSYGYDIVLSPTDLKIFTNVNSVLVDPRKVDPKVYVCPDTRIDEDGLTYVILPPNSMMLGHTRETFNIPRDILAICMAKSTYARIGVSLLVTPLEPEWKGVLVLEIVNNTNSATKIYPNQGIGQLLFLKADSMCSVSYADRAGKYQSQTSTQDAMV